MHKILKFKLGNSENFSNIFKPFFKFITLILYSLLDSLDGQIARNKKQGSPLGQLIDHNVDSLLLFPLIYNVIDSLNFLKFYNKIIWICCLNFLIYNLEEKINGKVVWGYINPTSEGIYGIGVFYLAEFVFYLACAAMLNHSLEAHILFIDSLGLNNFIKNLCNFIKYLSFLLVLIYVFSDLISIYCAKISDEVVLFACVSLLYFNRQYHTTLRIFADSLYLFMQCLTNIFKYFPNNSYLDINDNLCKFNEYININNNLNSIDLVSLLFLFLSFSEIIILTMTSKFMDMNMDINKSDFVFYFNIIIADNHTDNINRIIVCGCMCLCVLWLFALNGTLHRTWCPYFGHVVLGKNSKELPRPIMLI